MAEKEKIPGRVNFFLVIQFLFLLLFFGQEIAIAFEREIILEESYQTEQEKQRYQRDKEQMSFEDRFHLDFGIGYGFSYTQTLTGIYGPDSRTQTYLNQLGMEFSENLGTFRLRASYMLDPRTFAYFGVPFAVVKLQTEQGSRFVVPENEYKFGVGDLYGGLGHVLLPETEAIPSTTIYLDINADNAKYYSLGDGLWGITGAGRISKSLDKSFYVFGTGNYTERQEKNDIEPGKIVGYGGGVGFHVGSSRVEIGVTEAQIDETEFNNAILFPDNEDLTLNISVYSLFEGRGSFHFNWGNLDEGMDFERNTFGFEFSIPIL